jgi:hypothetical protein
MNAAAIIQTRSLDKAERISPECEVKPHPTGGFCIAERLAGSSAYIYHETHASEGYLRKLLADRRAEAMKAVLQGRIPGVDQAAMRDLGQLWMGL